MATAALLALLCGTLTSAQSSSDRFIPSPVSGVLTVSIPPPDVEISRGELNTARLYMLESLINLLPSSPSLSRLHNGSSSCLVLVTSKFLFPSGTGSQLEIAVQWDRDLREQAFFAYHVSLARQEAFVDGVGVWQDNPSVVALGDCARLIVRSKPLVLTLILYYCRQSVGPFPVLGLWTNSGPARTR